MKKRTRKSTEANGPGYSIDWGKADPKEIAHAIVTHLQQLQQTPDSRDLGNAILSLNFAIVHLS